jgi:Cu+-exporting ATPase
VAVFAVLATVLHASEGPLKALSIAASVFIISCSCALALAAPINRGLGLRRAKALGFHFRAQTTLEAVQDMRCVLFDKTGTLTFTHRNLSSLKWTAPFDRDVLARKDALAWLKSLSRHSLHPVSLSLYRALETVEDDACAFDSVREIAHFGLVGRASAPGFGEICLCRYGAWNDPDGPFAALGYAMPAIPIPAATEPAPETCLFLDGRLAAWIRFTEEIKPEVRDLVSGLRKRGVAVALLSGDNPEKVSAFAAACGIENHHAALSPEDKRRLAKQYRERYGRCLAVGDGFNDSLLFGESDLAMAVEGGAVDLLSGIDILFTGGKPSAIARLFRLSGSVRRGIRLSYWASGLYNAFAVALALQGLVTPLLAAILMPISSLSLCLIAYASISRE